MGEDSRHLALRAALAAVLHDVGKLGQRAGEVTASGKDHASVGEKFVAQYVPPQWRSICAPVGWHHGSVADKGLLTKIVALADRLSAGERDRYEDGQERACQLLSVFGGLNSGQRPDGPRAEDLYLPLRPLGLEESVLFPSRGLSDNSRQSYERLWRGFCAGMAGLQQVFSEGSDLESYITSVAGLLQKYTWCVPSAFYYDRPDVSLYDHLRTTAALSACFAQHWKHPREETEVDALLESIRGKEPKAWPEAPEVAGLLIGDLSGIQSFLYGFHEPKGAAATLRARSFYVQLLAELAARKALRELGLPPTNALYIGGGGFTLIVPPEAGGRIEAISRSINEVLLAAHEGQLYLALAFAPLVPKDFGIGGRTGGGTSPLAQRWAAVEDELSRRKRRRFAELDPEYIARLFAPQGFGLGQDAMCGVCGVESRDIGRDEAGVPWCRGCRALRELGRSLRRARYLMLAEVPEARSGGYPTWSDVARALGVEVAVGQAQPAPPDDSSRCLVVALTDEAEAKPGPRTAAARKPFVNIVPLVRPGETLPAADDQELRPDEIKHFGVLAHQSSGAPYLGVLRMDMDNLGKVFSRGLGSHDTLSRRATLSFHLSLFFEGWVGEAARHVCGDRGDRLYAVYSGGDDLFFAGSWDAVVDLARRIRSDFARFTGRPDLGISGGIVLAHEKYPLYLAAEKALAAEAAAKSVRIPKKDALSFLGIALPWERFGYGDARDDTVTLWAERFQALLTEEKAPRALIQRVQDFYLAYRAERGKRGPWGPWVWRAAYTLARAGERAPIELKREIHRLAELLAGDRFGANIEWLALAARWAELATRRGGQHDMSGKSGSAG